MKPLLLATAVTLLAFAQSRTATVRVDFGQKSGTLDTSRIALGQGGLSADLMWASRAPEIRALNPKLIRIFVGEYYDLLPARGLYNFESSIPTST